MRSSLLLLVALLAAACDGGPSEVGGSPGTRPRVAGVGAVSGQDLTDTIDARPGQRLTVQVLAGDPAVPAPNVAVRFEGVPVRVTTTDGCSEGCQVPSMLVAGAADAEFRATATATTNADGKATIRLGFGLAAGEGKILVQVPSLGFQETVRYTVRPGAAVAVRLMPRDTFAYIRQTFTARAFAVDRRANPRPEAAALSGAGLGIEGSRVTGTGYGVFRLHARLDGLSPDSTLVSVVPPGTVSSWYSRLFTVVDLDGSGRTTREFGTEYGGYDWSPDGGTLYATFSLSTEFPYRLHTVSADWTRTRLATGSPAFFSEQVPRLSSDGRWVHFVGIPSKLDSHLYRVKVDGSGLERLLQLSPSIHEWNARVFAVSPDQSRVFTVDDGGVRVTDLSTRTTRVLDGTIRPSFLRWSPDGEWIALGLRNSVEIMKPDGTGRKVIASRHEAEGGTIDWSPDGRWLVYDRANSAEIAEIGTNVRIPLRFLPSGHGGVGWRK